jgi:hypothetical protein
MKPVFILVVAICLLATISVKAQTLGFNFNSVTNHFASDGLYGFQFQVTNSVTINGLAAFDANAPSGIPPFFGSFPVTVELWTDSGTMLASTTISPGTLPVPGTSYCTAPITPMTLQPGTYRLESTAYIPWSSNAPLPNAQGLAYLSACYNSGNNPDSDYPDTLNNSHIISSANIVLQVPTPGIVSAGNQTTLYWPAASGNFFVQTSTDLASTNWTTVTNGITITGISVTNTSPQGFFRLQYKQP